MSRRLHFGIIILLIMTITHAHAQVEFNTVQNVRISSPAFKPNADIEGSPYVPSDTVRNGWLVNGTKRVPTKLRYNSYSGEVEFVQGNQIVAPVNAIAAFTILAADTLHFQKGFPAVETRSANDFYQILFDGRKTKLVRYFLTTIKSNTDAMSSDFGKKRFQKREDYYVWVANGQPAAEHYFVKVSEGTMKAVFATKKSLISLFPQQADRIEQYLADQKIKLKSWAEFADVLRYLETL